VRELGSAAVNAFGVLNMQWSRSFAVLAFFAATPALAQV
jgi:hypothetical protein